MQNRFLLAVDVETLHQHLDRATKLSSSFTADDKRELLKLAQDPTLPNKHAQSKHVEYALAYTQYHDILRTGSLSTAAEQEQHMAKIFFAALALQLLPKWVREKLMTNVIFDRAQIELSLTNKRLTAEDAVCLSQVIPLTTITTLDLRENEIGNDGAIALAANQTLTTLNLSGNQIGDAGAKAFAPNQTLTTLNVSDNQIGPDGAAALAANTTLKSLDVGWNKIGRAGAITLAPNQTLRTLNLSGNQIGDAVAKAFAPNQTLTSLNLSHNKVSLIGATALAANQTLWTLDLSFNKLCTDGKKALKETNPIKRYKAGKRMGVNTPFPTLTRLSMHAVKTNQDERLPSGKTLKEEADEKLPEEIKEALKKPKV